MPNPSFHNLRFLTQSNNKLRSLSVAARDLGCLPRLKYLDLRLNQLTSVDDVIRVLEKCNELVQLFLLKAGPPFRKLEEYAETIFCGLRGLKLLDNEKPDEKYAVTSDQEEAAEFLYDIANVGRNMIVHPDISNMNLRSEHFGVILAALCELRSVIKTIKLDNNPWDKSGVGPSRDHYRKFIVARMGDGRERGRYPHLRR